MRSAFLAVVAIAILPAAGCEPAIDLPMTSPTFVPAASVATAWGPERPPFNLQAVLRSPSEGSGFGLVRFRQPNGGGQVAYLDTWVRDLTPNASYRLQRAVDIVVDGACTSSGWLTLGAGTTPLAIVTDDVGTGRAELYRDLGVFPAGSRFDIHFRIVEDGTANVVLQSECHEFVITQ